MNGYGICQNIKQDAEDSCQNVWRVCGLQIKQDFFQILAPENRPKGEPKDQQQKQTVGKLFAKGFDKAALLSCGISRGIIASFVFAVKDLKENKRFAFTECSLSRRSGML